MAYWRHWKASIYSAEEEPAALPWTLLLVGLEWGPTFYLEVHTFNFCKIICNIRINYGEFVLVTNLVFEVYV